MTKSGKIFISYTHVDKEYLQDLKKYIQPLLRFQYSEFEAWDDTTLITGQKLFDKINTQLDKFGRKHPTIPSTTILKNTR